MFIHMSCCSFTHVTYSAIMLHHDLFKVGRLVFNWLERIGLSTRRRVSRKPSVRIVPDVRNKNYSLGSENTKVFTVCNHTKLLSSAVNLTYTMNVWARYTIDDRYIFNRPCKTRAFLVFNWLPIYSKWL